jgi:hypothetical protein
MAGAAGQVEEGRVQVIGLVVLVTTMVAAAAAGEASARAAQAEDATDITTAITTQGGLHPGQGMEGGLLAG